MDSETRHIVAAAEELSPGERKIVEIAGREIGVFNVDGNYFALRNVCPHKSGPLCLGRIRPLVTSLGINHYAHERDNEILKCPWHQWEFDIKTGRALFDQTLRVRTYRVSREGDEIVLYTNGNL